MIEVVKAGRRPEDTPINVTCRHCSSELRFCPSDRGVLLVKDQRDGDYYSFACPVCSKQVTRARRVEMDGKVYRVAP